MLAGMGGVARSELVAAVTEAGGFGFLGMVREPVSLIRTEVARVRERTDRDFGVNLIPAATDPALLDAQITECIALAVPVVGLFWDLSKKAIRRLRDAGLIVVCQVGSPGEACDAQAAGAHALIAQGREAGGHVRGLTPRDVLLPAILAAVDIPVLAAGGVSRGAHLAEILAQGGDGAVVGTAFLATRESFAHDYHKQRIVTASADDTILTDIFHVNWPIGAPVRVLRNSVTSGTRGDPFADERVVIGEEEGRPIYLFSTDSPLRSMTGDFEAMALYAGQGVGLIDTIPSAGERLRTIVDEAAAILSENARIEIEDTPPESSSPVCLARDADNTYMGFASREEVIALLDGFVAMKRARARALLRSALEAADPGLRRDLLRAYHLEAEWLCKLTAALRSQSEKPPRRIDQSYRKAMTIADIAERLCFLDDSQARLFASCRTMLPRIRDDVLYAELKHILSEN